MKTTYDQPVLSPPEPQLSGRNRFISGKSRRPWLQALSGLCLLALLWSGSVSGQNTLQIASSPPDVVLTWSDTNAQLQSAFFANGPWASVPGAHSPFQLAPAESQQFFRLLISAGGTNLPPVVSNYVYSVTHDQSLVLTPPGVLASDSDPNGYLLTAAVYSPAQHGTVVINPDGSLAYTPDPGFVGTDSFTYVAYDGVLPSPEATVTVNVLNQAPVAVDDSFGAPRNSSTEFPAPGVLANDSDPDGDTLHAILVGAAGHGTVVLRTDGSFHYTPNAGYSGPDSFTYQASDGIANSGTATVTLTVHSSSQQLIASNLTYHVAHDHLLTVTAPGVLGAVSNPDGDSLTAELASPASNGNVVLSANGSFTYQPNAGFSGSDSFSYLAQSSATSSAPAVVTLLVTNNAPVAVADTYYVEPNTSLVVEDSGVLENDTDADGDTLTAQLQSGPSFGALTFSTNGGFTYTPNTNFTGSDSFTYVASDGVTTSAPALVTLLVTNRPPIGSNDIYGVCYGQLLTVLAPGVLYNDSDPDGDALTAVNPTLPAHGTLNLAADGSFTYQPDAGYSGPDSFTYEASDGALSSGAVTVSLMVNTNCVTPIGVPDNYATRANIAVTNGMDDSVLANDIDPLGVALTAQLVSGVTNGTLTFNSNGTFVYTPNTDFVGTDGFVYQASNGTLSSGPVPVTITVEDLAPVSANDSYAMHAGTVLNVEAPGVLDNDYDPDEGDDMNATLVSTTQHGVLAFDPSGSFTYTPNAGYVGVDSFTYTADDGVLTGAVAVATINIQNQTPLAGDDTYSVVMNSTLTVGASGVLDNDYDGDDDPLTAVLVSGPAHASSFSLGPDGSFSYTPLPGFTGADSFTYVASDGLTNSPAAQVAITVTSTPGPLRRPFAGGPPELDLTGLGFLGGNVLASDTARVFAFGQPTGTPIFLGFPQWVNNAGDGFLNALNGDRNFPYSYVRNSLLKVRTAFQTPARAVFQGANIAIRGTVFNNGAAMGVLTKTRLGPIGITPNRVGPGGIIFLDMQGSVRLPNTVGVANLSIEWEFSVDGGTTWLNCGHPIPPAGLPNAFAEVSEHKIYLTFAAPTTSPLFETLVSYGCEQADGLGLGPNGNADRPALVAKVWANFENQNAARADGTPLHYYRNWNVIQNPSTAVPNLLLLADGRCGTWAQFFINALQAQGLAPVSLRATGVRPKPAFGVGMLVSQWNQALNIGPAGPNYPGNVNVVFRRNRALANYPVENVLGFNQFDGFWPQTAAAPGGVWQYVWGANPPQFNYVGGQGANKGQNNPTPRSIFMDHAIVLFNGTYYDPSYGLTYLGKQDMQNTALNGVCFWQWETDQIRVNNGPVVNNSYRVLHIKPTPPGSRVMIDFFNP